MMLNQYRFIASLALLLGWFATRLPAERVLPSLSVQRGPINAVVLHGEDASTAVYNAGDVPVQQLLLTHHRRDVVWPAQRVRDECWIVAPASERGLIDDPQSFWDGFVTQRFHDYGQASTKVLDSPQRVSKWVSDGDLVQWKGPELSVLSTPGYTPGSVSYVATIDDQKVVFTGDLIYGDGKIIDLFSFQDAIPEANVRGYHGYGARLAALVASLQRIAALDPDLLVPARGPVIRHPKQAIDRLIRRVRALYANYLSTSALNWYFKEERMQTCGRRVLAENDPIELMSYSLHQPAPDWVFEHATSRLLISDSGHAFLIDCGYQRVIDTIDKLIQMGVITKLDGIFVTHYHDDHTDMVQSAAEQFECPVYAVGQYADVLEHPEKYHLPAMTSKPIAPIRSMSDGAKIAWQEFELTFHFFPGQTFYHGGLFVRRGDERPVFFVGDAFAPSGIDDYCMLNRNLAHEDTGYPLCFRKLRDIKEKFWLVNEHIPFVFEFSPQEMDYLESRYRARTEILRELFPWDDPNYGIDEQWAFFYPYGVEVEKGEAVELQLRIENHSPGRRSFTVTPRVSRADVQPIKPTVLSLASREVGTVVVKFNADTTAGTSLVTADVTSEGMEFRDWAEAMITVKP